MAHETHRSILVTGGNKGIGLAICQAILSQHADTKVFLGSRDRARGEAAAATLGADAAARMSVVLLDVGDDASVAAAAAQVAAELGGAKLYGVVNNAGILPAAGAAAMADCLNVNVRGCKRVVDAFAGLVRSDGGRVVFISSAAGPSFVEGCSAVRQRALTDPAATWADVEATMAANVDLLSKGAPPEAFEALGFKKPGGEWYSYGLSKACLNMYNHVAAREHPSLVINACTPGFIETDLTRPLADSSRKSPAEMGMKPPEHGAHSAMALLFSPDVTSGCYYGSDGVRSPLHKYRAPGDPPYTGAD